MSQRKTVEFLKKADPVYLLILIILIFYRILVLVVFNFRYTDGDQTVMWQGLRDFSQGIFHEPRFYGQGYNSMIESLLAMPLYWLGLPAYKALPVITNLLAILPYVVLSGGAFRKGMKMQAYLILSLSLFLAPQYDLITSIPRGFVTGIFFASLGAIAVFHPGDRRWFLVSGFLFAFGYALNPNSLLISFPCLLYLLLVNLKRPGFYLLAGAGLLVGLIVHVLANYFYILNPAYDLHHLYPSVFSFRRWWSAFSNLDIHFNFLTPFFWKMGWLILPILTILAGVLFYRKQWREVLVVLVSLGVLLVTLGYDRMYMATPSVFFSYARMYLAVPVLLAIFITFLPVSTGRTKYLFLLLVAGFALQKTFLLEKVIQKDMSSYEKMVNVCSIPELQRECRKRMWVADKYHLSLIVESWNRYYTLGTYGCPFCEPRFPNTLYPYYERRTWRMMEDDRRVYPNLMIVGIAENTDSLFRKSAALKVEVFRLGDYYIIRNNPYPAIPLLRSLGFTIRPF
ncbi:MAG TPA: hypothetical protein VMC08_03525 [Bacteroidales bacterium]|nr:hypothetical protein [Bacteroidales bacterium]